MKDIGPPRQFYVGITKGETVIPMSLLKPKSNGAEAACKERDVHLLGSEP